MKIVEPEVTLIAKTETTLGLLADEFIPQAGMSGLETLTEFAGRSCYQSFNRPNPATNTTDKYLNRTLFEQGHWSIAEHASVTFYITGVSRAFTHELVRHRHLSYSQLSQRFVDESDTAIVIPPAVVDHSENYPSAVSELQEFAETALSVYEDVVEALQDNGFERKQAREAARAVLPNMVETRIVVTGNLRAWHEFCERRMKPDADAEMQQVATMIYSKLNLVAPTIFPAVKETKKEDDEQMRRFAKLIDLKEGAVISQDIYTYYKKDGFWREIDTPSLRYASCTIAEGDDFLVIWEGE